MKIVADTSFTSALLKADALELITKLFKIKHILITDAVFAELTKNDFIAELLEHYKELIKITNSEPIQAASLGLGERESINLTRKLNALLLVDDRLAHLKAQKLGVMAFALPDFLLACKEKRLLNKKKMQDLIHRLEERDYYKFKSEVKKELLRW